MGVVHPEQDTMAATAQQSRCELPKMGDRLVRSQAREPLAAQSEDSPLKAATTRIIRRGSIRASRGPDGAFGANWVQIDPNPDPLPRIVGMAALAIGCSQR